MTIRKLCLVAPCLLFACQCALVAAPAAPEKSAPGAKSAAVAPENPEAGLKQAMAAEAVRQIMGKPDEIRPMKAPNGKAEIWAYKRTVGERVERVEIGSIPVTTTVYGADGKAHDQNVGETIQYGDLHIVTEELVEVLMFNDHYVTHKVTRQERKHFN